MVKEKGNCQSVRRDGYLALVLEDMQGVARISLAGSKWLCNPGECDVWL